MSSKISLLIDSALSFVAALLLSFCFFRLIDTPRMLSIVCAALFAVTISCIVFLKKRSELVTKLDAGKLTRAKKALAHKLVMLKKTQLTELFKALLLQNGNEVNENAKFVETKTSVLIPLFLPQPLTANDIAKLLKENDFKEKKVCILSCSFDTSAASFAAGANIELFSIEQVYPFVIKLAPDFITDSDYKKVKTFDFSLLFFKKNGRKFILYGILLDIFSLLSFYPVYYVISGTIFISFGLITAFFGKNPQINTSSLSDFLS